MNKLEEIRSRVKAGEILHDNIFLIGFMGAGKSTVANALQEMLGMNYVEMDQLIVEQQKMPISEIFAEYGEDYFRDVESRLLLELQKRSQTIVSCGGGVVVREHNQEIMKTHGRVVLLTARPETVYNRVKDNTDRPILNQNMSVEYIAALQEKRRALYEAAADIVVATDGKTPEEICLEIIEKLISMDS